MKLDKAQSAKKGAKLSINKKPYAVMEVHKQEGVLQLLLSDAKEEAFFVLMLPEKGEGEVKFLSLQSHGDHFHPGEEIELKSLD